MVWSLLSAAVPLGDYATWWKAIPPFIILLIWGKLITWVDKDSQEVLLPRIPLNIGLLTGGVLAFVLFFLVPGFPIALLILLLVLAIEAGVYLAMRNSKVGLGDLGTKFNAWVSTLKGGEKEVKVVQGEVQLIGKSGSLMPTPTAEDPVRPAYDAVQTMFTDPLRRNAERIDLTPQDAASMVRYVVDGVGYSGATIERSRAAAAIEYLKQMAGMDVNEKRKPQAGSMKVTLDNQRRELQIQTAGSSSGEQLRANVDIKKRYQLKLDELGLTEDQLFLVQEVIKENSGIVLVGAPRGQGLTTLMYAILRAHDAFLQHIQTIESEPGTDLEGITQNKVSSTPNPAEDLKTTDWVISQEPDIIMATRVDDAKVAASLSRYAGNENRRVYIAMRAGTTFEALSQWRKLVGDEAKAAKNLRMIITGRVLRKLCAACKAGYTPDPTTLRKLNMDPDKVGKLFQARTQPMRDAKGNPIPCEFCKELYYKGRTGVYEVFYIDDEVRAVIEAGGSLNQLKAAFRKQRGKYLQEAALAQVEAGETSIQEVLRIMKPEDKRPGSSGK